VIAPPRLSTLAIYAMAHAGKTLFWTVSDLYFTWVVIEVGGLSAGWAGLGIGLSILLAAGADIVLGRRLGSRIASATMASRIQLRACIATGVALLLFAGVGLVQGKALAATMMVGLIAFRLTYAGLDITQNALPALIARGERERAAYGMWRTMSGGLARIALSAAFVPLLMHRLRQDQALNFLAMALVIALLATGAAFLLHQRLHADSQEAPGLSAPAPSLPGKVSPRTVPLTLAMASASMGMTLFQQLEPFFAAQALRRESATVFLTAGALGMVGCQPFWRRLTLGSSERRTRVAIMASCLIGAMLMLADRGQELVWASAAGLAYGCGAGGVTLWLWVVALDCPPARAMVRISSFSASAKVGQAVSIVAACALLQGGFGVEAQSMVMAGALLLAACSMLIARPG